MASGGAGPFASAFGTTGTPSRILFARSCLV